MKFDELRHSPSIMERLQALAYIYPELTEEDGLPPTSGKFECIPQGVKELPSSWEGNWHIYALGKHYVELDVIVGGFSYWTIVGRYACGHYLCLPDWSVGCRLADDLQDYFYNYKTLAALMDPFHAASVVQAIADFSLRTGWELQWPR